MSEGSHRRTAGLIVAFVAACREQVLTPWPDDDHCLLHPAPFLACWQLAASVTKTGVINQFFHTKGA